MLYRFLRGFNEIYPIAVLFAFIAAFFVAFAFTVIYPLVPIILIISSVFVVVIARVTYLVMRGFERRLALAALRSDRCPACSAGCDAVRVGERRVLECPDCRRCYDEDGAPYVPQERMEDAEKPATFERVASDPLPGAGGA